MESGPWHRRNYVGGSTLVEMTYRGLSSHPACAIDLFSVRMEAAIQEIVKEAEWLGLVKRKERVEGRGADLYGVFHC